MHLSWDILYAQGSIYLYHVGVYEGMQGDAQVAYIFTPREITILQPCNILVFPLLGIRFHKDEQFSQIFVKYFFYKYL
jgi:hypothetical protein